MAVFNSFVPTLSVNEGGYQNIPEDKGNYNSNNELVGTNHGISAPVLERYLGYPPSVYDMKYLSYETALNIFKSQFWDKMNGDLIQNQAVAETVIDHGINSSPYRATIILQEVLNVYFNKNLVVDGIFGQNTLNAVNSVNATELFIKYSKARENYYRSLSQFSIFGNSWLNRITTIANKFKIFLTTSNNGLLPITVIGIVGVLAVGGYILLKTN